MESSPLLFGYCFSSTSSNIKLESIKPQLNPENLVWYHLDGNNTSTEEVLNKLSLSPLIIKNLLSEDTRPSVKTFSKSGIVTLRCMNFNPDSSPENMVALHLLISDSLIITIRREKILAIEQLINDLEDNHLILTQTDFITQLIKSINKSIENVIYDIEDQVDSMEEYLLDSNIYELRTSLSLMRRKIVAIRRYIVPQREVLAHLHTSTTFNFTENGRWQLRDSFEKLIRIIEDLDLIRDRASLIHEEINNKMAENMNKTMFMLSIVATIFCHSVF